MITLPRASFAASLVVGENPCNLLQEAYENPSILDKLLPNTGGTSESHFDKNVAAIDHGVIREYQPKEEMDQYESEGIDDLMKDEWNLCNWSRSWRIGWWLSSSSKSMVDVIATTSDRHLHWPRVPLKGTRNSCGSFDLCYCGSSWRQWEPDAKDIIVQVLNIGPITITVPQSWKVQDICESIKRTYMEKIYTKRKGYVLTYNGNVLEKSKKLSDYLIQNWETLKFEKQ